MGPDGDVAVAVVVVTGRVGCVVAGVADRGREDAADLEAGGPVGTRVAGAAGRVALVAVVDVSSVVVVDGLD